MTGVAVRGGEFDSSCHFTAGVGRAEGRGEGRIKGRQYGGRLSEGGGGAKVGTWRSRFCGGAVPSSRGRRFIYKLLVFNGLTVGLYWGTEGSRIDLGNVKKSSSRGFGELRDGLCPRRGSCLGKWYGNV